MSDKPKILIVEDEAITAHDLKGTLDRLGFEPTGIATNGNDAISMIKKNKPDLILMDIVLKDNIDGIEVARKIKKKFDVPIVYLTAYADNKMLERAQMTEPYGYIIKPYDHRELHSSILFALYKHKTDQQLKESLEKLKRSLESTVTALATAVEKRDPYTAGHQRRVAILACTLGEEMGLTKNDINGLRIASLIHDIGKINIPAEILCKPCALTEAEYEIVQTHPQIGYDIIKSIDFPWPISTIIIQHHERLDGSGYPNHLTDSDLLVQSKIIMIADVVEAMLSHRPYRPAHDFEKVYAELESKHNSYYDADIAGICINLFTKNGFNFKNL